MWTRLSYNIIIICRLEEWPWTGTYIEIGRDHYMPNDGVVEEVKSVLGKIKDKQTTSTPIIKQGEVVKYFCNHKKLISTEG